MKKTVNKPLFIASVVIYAVLIVLMAVGTSYDLQIDKKLFNPQSSFAIVFEQLGQVVYWGMWGPLFTVLFLNRHELNECLEIIGRFLPFVKPIKNTDTKVYATLKFLTNVLFTVGFYVLAVVGWKKLIENVLKKFVDLSGGAYFGICAVVAVIFIFLFSKIDRRILKKLEALALAGVLAGLCFWIIEHLKGITARVRFREMVAYSNSIIKYEDDGTPVIPAISHGGLDSFTSKLSKDMVKYTDFSPFTKWYEKGDTSLTYYDKRNSFPSGHTVYSCTLFLSALFCNAFSKLKKFAPYAFIVSAAYVSVMAFSRLVAGAHYLTDVAAGFIIGYTVILCVYKAYEKFNEKGILASNK